MSAPAQKKGKTCGEGQLAVTEPEGFLLYKGGNFADEIKQELTRVRIAPHVTEIASHAFCDCQKLVEVQFNEGLLTIGAIALKGTSLRIIALPSTATELGCCAFANCQTLTAVQLNDGLRNIRENAFESCALRCVVMPSTVTGLFGWAFYNCINLTDVQLNEGLRVIGGHAFRDCTALRSLSIPSTVTELGQSAFQGCSSLSEVIFLGGERLLEQEFFAHGLFSGERGLLNQGKLDEILYDEDGGFTFRECPLTTVKISISWAVSERMSRLTPECKVSVEERMSNLPNVELNQDGTISACFPLVRREPDNEAEDDSDAEDGDRFIQDTNLETAGSVYQVLQLIAFHELKESSIMIELAVWKSRINGDRAYCADCRVAIPCPAKSLIMEYCGFVGFVRPAMEGA